MRIPAFVAAVALIAVALTAVQSTVSPAPAQAAIGAQFNPGMIISDALFYDGTAMNADQVQNFLNSQVRTCTAGYTCLKSYHQATATRPAEASNCATYVGSADETAATIITRVGQACGISQKVLIVLLQKEQGLVTSTAPASTRYRSATGYGCPDTAACDSTYYGFFNQVYMAALQFKRYAANPTHWAHVAGRLNSVAFNPSASCGASNVLIQNTATAGLYDYTPYQPNAAALANLYGTGNSCSSYGNRNFWAYYTDWFGSTTVYSLMRTNADPSVFLVAGTMKYPVSAAVFPAYAALGGVSFVSPDYLASLTTGQAAGRIIRGPDGAIYFIDAAIKTQFTSCDLVVDYGGSCSATGYVQLTDAQIAAFHTGPYATPVLGTVEGGRYLLDNGTKRDVLDNQAQTDAGLAPGFNVLTDAAVASLPWGPPILRDGVFAQTTGTSTYSFITGGRAAPVTQGDAAVVGASSRSAGTIHAASLALVPAAPAFTGAVTAGAGSDVQLLTAAGRLHLTVPGLTSALGAVTVPQAFLDGYPDAGSLAAGSFVLASSNPTVYAVADAALRSVPGWSVLVGLAGTSSPKIVTLTSAAVAAIPKGSPVLAPGMMYRSPGDAQIYLINGASERIRVTSFDFSTALGFTKWETTSQSVLDGYTTNAAPLGSGVVCAGVDYVASAGQLRSVSTAALPLFPIPFLPLDASTCAKMTIGAPATAYIRTADGSIYQLVGGQKRHLSLASWTAALPASNTWMSVTPGFAAAIPSGPAS